MNLGTSQIDITPQPGVELSGFAARVQPSTGLLDPLFAKALYLVCGQVKFLWIHCDLIGLDRATVLRFRKWAAQELGLAGEQVMISATHTHAGPGTIHLREAGEYDAEYVEFLLARLQEAARAAASRTEKCELVAAEGHLTLAIDRRKTATPHTDPRVAALGFRRPDGSFAAAIVNYAIHPVALGPENRLIGTDISGQAALSLSERLPGKPMVLITNGACANLNPPAVNVTFEQVQAWGRMLAEVAGSSLLKAGAPCAADLRIMARTVRLPLEVLSADEINKFADHALHDPVPLSEWGDKYRRVVEHWRHTLLKNGMNHDKGHHEAELFGVCLNGVTLVGVNAEVFSEFTDLLRRQHQGSIYLVGYANGDVGYLPTAAAYAEGGYEVEVAHMFYGGFRFKPGSLESLAAAASNLVADLAGASKPEARPEACLNSPPANTAAVPT